MAHAFKDPHRMLCSIDFSSCCQTENYTANDISSCVAGPLKVGQWVAKQPLFLPVILLAPFILYLLGVNDGDGIGDRIEYCNSLLGCSVFWCIGLLGVMEPSTTLLLACCGRWLAVMVLWEMVGSDGVVGDGWQ